MNRKIRPNKIAICGILLASAFLLAALTPVLAHEPLTEISDSMTVWTDDFDDLDELESLKGLNIEDGKVSLLNLGFDPVAWDKKGLTIPNGTATDVDCRWTMQPFVLKDNGIYKMWYTGYRNPHPDYTYSIMYATSTDAENWTKQGVAFGPDSVTMKNNIRGMAVPCVLKEADGYKMYYSGQDADTTSYFEMYMATSDDGLNWVDQGKILGNGPYGTTDFMGLDNGKVIKMPDGTYKMVYVGYDGVTKKLHMATSSDGVSWQKEGMFLNTSGPGSPDFMWLTEPFMVYHNDTYLLWYSGYPYYGQTVICFATSVDGQNWTKHGEVLGPSIFTDSMRVGGSNVMVDDEGLVRMWYYGFNSSHLIHYAETDYLSEFYISPGEMITKPISISEDKAWASLNISRTGIDLDNTILVSIQDADTGINIGSFVDLEEVDIDISNISCLDHPNLQLVAKFKGNGLNSPVLESWSISMKDDANLYPVISSESGEMVIFDCTTCFNHEDMVNCTWIFEYNRTHQELYGNTCEFCFWTPGNYSILVIATDSEGEVKRSKILIDVMENSEETSFSDYVWLGAILVVGILLALFMVLKHRKDINGQSPAQVEKEISETAEATEPQIDILESIEKRFIGGYISEATYIKLKEKYSKENQ